MADGIFFFETNKSLSANGTSYSSNSLATRDKRDFAFLISGTRTGAPGTVDITIEESPESDFADATKIRTLSSFTQLLSTSGDFIEKVNVTDSNVNSFLRSKIVLASFSSGGYSNLDVSAIYNTKI